MAGELEALTLEVEETKGIVASAITLIEGIAAKLAEAGTDPAKLAALTTDLNASSEALAAAVAAHPI